MSSTTARIVLLTVYCAFFSLTASAADGPTINVHIPPEVSKMEKEYDDTVSKLTRSQQDQLKALDAAAIDAATPELALALQNAQFQACAQIDPTVTTALTKNMQSYKLNKIDEMRERGG